MTINPTFPNLVALILRFNSTVIEEDDKFVIIYTKVSDKNEMVLSGERKVAGGIVTNRAPWLQIKVI